MAAPMKPAEPTRDQQITAKENAIKKRLQKRNTTNQIKAKGQVAAELSKMRKGHRRGDVVRKYQTQAIRGSKEGYAKSDFGVGAGAAVPYQIGTYTNLEAGSTKPKPKLPPSKRNTTPKWVGDAKSEAKAGAIIRRATAAGNKVKGL